MSNTLQRWMPWVFFFSFFPLGAIFPYLVHELEHKGIFEIGLLLSLPSLMSLLVAPLWGILADWLGNWGIVLKLSSIIALFGLGILSFADPQWVFAGMWCYAIGLAPISPVTDALALEAVSETPERYGSLRLWGSVGYMFGVFGVGTLQFFLPLSALNIGFWSMTIFVVLAWQLPAPCRKIQLSPKEGLHLLLQNKTLIWILFCSAIHFSVHLANSNFLVVHLNSLGFDNIWVGISVTMGIIVEIVVLQKSAPLLSRFSAKNLFQMAAMIAIMRWCAMAIVSSAIIISLLQASHGLSFGLFWIAAMQLVKSNVPKEAMATGQSLLAASVGGVGATIGVYVASEIVERYDTQTMYWTGAIVATLAYLSIKKMRE